MIDLADDIRSVLSARARGSAHAMPRRVLLAELHRLGRTVSDRALRRAYADMADVGSSLAGIFLIVTAEDRRVSCGQLAAPAASMFERKRQIEKAAPQGQMTLWGGE